MGDIANSFNLMPEALGIQSCEIKWKQIKWKGQISKWKGREKET